jgi:hypothetical protein
MDMHLSREHQHATSMGSSLELFYVLIKGKAILVTGREGP